jgi:hypothetical protein
VIRRHESGLVAMRLLFCGDIGRAGRDVVVERLPA